jgi:hypothetical protein
LQVRRLYEITINQSQMADTRSRQSFRVRRPKRTAAHDEHTRREQTLLTASSDSFK